MAVALALGCKEQHLIYLACANIPHRTEPGNGRASWVARQDGVVSFGVLRLPHWRSQQSKCMASSAGRMRGCRVTGTKQLRPLSTQRGARSRRLMRPRMTQRPAQTADRQGAANQASKQRQSKAKQRYGVSRKWQDDKRLVLMLGDPRGGKSSLIAPGRHPSWTRLFPPGCKSGRCCCWCP